METKKTKENHDTIVKWIATWFKDKIGPAVIGISGGKDSTVCAALLVEALGKERVIGVMMPNGEQKDIDDSKKVCELLGIKSLTVNIGEAYKSLTGAICVNLMKDVAVGNLDEIFRNDVTAQAFLNNIDSALANITGRKTEIGATQQRVAAAMEVANVMSTNFTSANSLIKDADIAEESSNYIKNQILQQTASSLLATANQNPQIALQLI